MQIVTSIMLFISRALQDRPASQAPPGPEAPR